MTAGINQIQMAYKPEEDRILFRVNTLAREEFRFWVTRRYAMICLKVLQDHLNRDPDISAQQSIEAKTAVREFKQEQAQQNADYSRVFSSDAATYPLGEEPRLAFKLSYAFKGDLMTLTIEPETGQGISLVINRELNTSMTRLILSANRQAGWFIESSLEQQGSPAGVSADTIPQNGEVKIIN